MQLTQFRKTEIENFDSRARQKDIARLYVAMNDPTAVGVRKRRCNLDGVLEKLLHRKRTSCQSARERFPFEKFHHQVPHTGVLTDVVYGTNPRMVEPGGKPRFLVEATMHLCQVAKARADYLDRDVTRQPCIPCAVHVPMPPLPASVTISYGPRRAPGASGVSIPLSVAVSGRDVELFARSSASCRNCARDPRGGSPEKSETIDHGQRPLRDRK